MICDDALISRSRSRGTAYFLAGDADVLFMCDHDIAWNPGDLWLTASHAFEKNALVAGLYSRRVFGQGTASRISEEGVRFTVGGDKLHRADYLGTGFLAIPRTVLEGTLKVCKKSWNKNMIVHPCGQDVSADIAYYDLFRPIVVEDKMSKTGYSYLSEDWAFSARVRFAKFPLFIYEKPVLTHHGEHGYTVLDSVRKLS